MNRETRLAKQRAASLQLTTERRARGECPKCGVPSPGRCADCRRKVRDAQRAQAEREELPNAGLFINTIRVLTGRCVLPGNHDGLAGRAEANDVERFAVWDSWRGLR